MSDEENHSNDDLSTKPLIAETKICSICLLSGSTDDNDPIVYCDRCGIIVHESCYNADSLDDKSSDSSSPSEFWFCTPCLAQIDHPICALCPTEDQCLAFWPTLESTWIHVVCALAVPGVLFYDELYYTPVDLSNISAQKFGNKACHFCESRSGVTVSCDAGLCPNAFHLSCAHKNGLLQIRGELSKIECELYCVNHQSVSQTYKNVQRNFTICEVQQKQLDHREKLNENVAKTLNEHNFVYKKRIESFPRLPKPSKNHLARSIISDPIALKNFFDKAQRFRSNQTTNCSNNFDLTSTNTNALLAFAANEEELTQIRQRIKDAEIKLQQLESTSIEKQLKEENKKLENELKKEYEILTSLTERFNEFLNLFQHFNCQLKDETKNSLGNLKFSQLNSTEIDRCSVCKQTDRLNQMIKCCQCQMRFHGDCLKPSLNVKTLSLILSANKKFDWQCASCVNAQQEELDQCNVNIDEPRQIRPRKTNELVLRETLIKFGSRKRKENNFNENDEKIENKKNKFSTDEFISTQSRTSVIEKLFSKKTNDVHCEKSTSKRSSFSPKKKLFVSKDENSSRISNKTFSTTKSDDFPVSIRSKSLTIEREKPKIFKEKSSSFSIKNCEKKKRQTTKDPMSIFDFYDDDENANDKIELHSKTSNQNEKKLKKSHRRSTSIIENKVPSDVLCVECSKKGTNQTMTDCDKCRNFYHFVCCFPPLTSFPKRRNYGWTCHRCNNDSEHEIISQSPSKDSRRERKIQNRYGEKEFFVET